MNDDYLRYMRERQASTSVGASTARGMGPKGTVKAARDFLRELKLSRFLTKSEKVFRRELDLATDELRVSLPKDAQYWGSARKFLNIFLRGCSYNKYLCAHFKLQSIEPWLEVPLDSHVVKGLKSGTRRGALPRWTGVIHLTPELSDAFQSFASTIAMADGVNRVDLDIKYWRRVGRSLR